MTLLLMLALGAADVRPTVAVMYFDYSGKDESLAVLKKGFAQILISDLSTLDGIRLVEREKLEAVMTEQKLGSSGAVDPATAARIGKILGARYLVLGSYFELGGALRADARVVEVETSKVVTSSGFSGAPGEFMDVERKLATDLGKVLAKQEMKPAAVPLKTKTAVHYSKALDAADKGDKKVAKQEMEAVVKEQPDFKLAQSDLKKMMQ